MNARELSGFQVHNVRNSPDEELMDGARALWLEERALTRDQADQRARELLLVATEHDSDRVAGMATTYLITHPVLKLQLWAMRAFVGKAWRQQDVGYHMLFAALEHHRSQFESGADTRGCGLYMEIENPVIQRARNEAIWPKSGFCFIGVNGRGDHCRVRYFDGAKIEFRHQ